MLKFPNAPFLYTQCKQHTKNNKKKWKPYCTYPFFVIVMRDMDYGPTANYNVIQVM